jgi:hypothetical protein
MQMNLCPFEKPNATFSSLPRKSRPRCDEPAIAEIKFKVPI